MRSPEGQDFPNVGCYLEIVENVRLIWTTALVAGHRPAEAMGHAENCGVDFFTAVISLEAAGQGTRYTALAIHGDAEDKGRHAAMGFHDGWTQA